MWPIVRGVHEALLRDAGAAAELAVDALAPGHTAAVALALKVDAVVDPEEVVLVRRVVGLGLVREVEGRQALGEEQGVATAAVDVDGPDGVKRSLLTDGAKPPVDLLRLRCGLEELHDLRVEAAAESRVLGEMLRLGDLCVAHVAEELKVGRLVATALGHGPRVVHLEDGKHGGLAAEHIALPVEFVAAGVALVLLSGTEGGHDLLGHAGAAVVGVLVDEALHEAWQLSAVVWEAHTGPLLEGLGERPDLLGLL